MKRSEMLQIMVNIIHDFRRNTMGTTSVELGEMILRAQEEFGMLPPECDRYRTDLTFPKNTYYWEPEEPKNPWINTTYYYNEGGQEQKIMYDPNTFNINRWDSVHGDDILKKEDNGYRELFLTYVLPLILKDVDPAQITKLAGALR